MLSFNQPKKRKKIGIWIVFVLLILFIYLFTKKITLDAKINIEPGENVSKIFAELSTLEQFRIKLHVFTHRKSIDFSKLETGNYTFNGKYTKTELIQQILKGSEKDYLILTILEGRSIYDIDEALTRKGYIETGTYKDYVTDRGNISELMQGYEFLRQMPTKIGTLEGFLYPDTYHVYKNKAIIPQLTQKQLQGFDTKVRKKINEPKDFYQTLILASILEKEERNIANKAIVAGIFLKRLDIGMKLDADITLCYGLKTSYTDCTPTIIAKNIGSTKNTYNTRTHKGLTPTPIANPTWESINAVINPQTSNYLYYLHDMEGYIHYGITLEEHNANKAKYLQ